MGTVFGYGLALGLTLLACSNQASAPRPSTGSATSDAAALALDAMSASAVLVPDAAPPREVIECPVIGTDDDYSSSMKLGALYQRLLVAANDALTQNNPAAAWTCADRAADLSSRAAEPQLLAANALLALARYQEASLAVSTAVAFAPDDPNVLFDAADLYLRWDSPEVAGTAASKLALEYASAGFAAAKRQRAERSLLASLAVQKARAQNALGQADAALQSANLALSVQPDTADAWFEQAVAYFDLHQFAKAKAALTLFVARHPDDAHAQHLLGATLDWLADPAAEGHFARAATLDASHFFTPTLLSQAEIEAEIAAVIASLPAARRAALAHVRFEVVDLPSIDDLESVSPPFPPSILGLYRAGEAGLVVVPGNRPANGPAAGPSIALFRKNLAQISRSRAALLANIRDTVLHEIGHAEGLDEDDLRRRRME